MKTKAPHFPDEKKVCQNEAAQLVTELWKIIKLGEKKTTSLKKNQVRYECAGCGPYIISCSAGSLLLLSGRCVSLSPAVPPLHSAYFSTSLFPTGVSLGSVAACPIPC